MYEKNFIKWWTKKQNINTSNNIIYPKEREIWFVYWGVNKNEFTK